MKNIKTFRQFLNENINESTVPAELKDSAESLLYASFDDYGGRAKMNLKKAQRKYSWLIVDHGRVSGDIGTMNIDDAQEILKANDIKFEFFNDDETGSQIIVF